MNPTLIIAAISAAVSGVAGFGLAWRLQSGNIAELENDYANTRMAEQRAAHAVKERQLDAVIKAQNNGAARVAILRRDADLARGAIERLSEQSADSLRTAATSLDACNRVAATHSLILTESSGVIQTMGRDADQCFSDLTLMKDAWPR